MVVFDILEIYISVCLFCLLETISVNEFMISLSGSACWHFTCKVCWQYCQGNIQFLVRFFDLQDFDISIRVSARSYLKSRQDSWRVFGCQDLEILPRSQRESCSEFWQVFGRRDFEISPRSRRVLVGKIAEISVSILRSQTITKILTEMSVKILHG